MARTESATLVVGLLDKVTGPARQVAGSIRGIGNAAREVDRTVVGRLNAALDANSRRMDMMRARMLDAVASAYALSRALGAPVRSAMEFESAMADVTKVVDFGPGDAVKRFEKDLLDLSARLPVAVSGLANIAAAAGQAGIAGAELLKFTEGAAKIGVAFDISAASAGDALAKLRTGLGYSTEQVFRLADAMNELSNRQASSASDVLDFTTRVGAMAKMFGFTAEQAAAFGSAMISSGAAPDVAATSFNNMGRALTKGAAATTAQRKAFKALGLDAVNVSKAMQKDAVKATTDVMERIAKLPADKRAAIVSQLFGDEARALSPLLTNLDLLKESLDVVADATTYADSANREYAARSKTSANAVQLFQNRLERLSITIGKALIPAMTKVMDFLEPIISRLADLADRFPKVTAGIISAAAGFVGLRIAGLAASFALGSLRGGALIAGLGLAKIGTAALALGNSFRLLPALIRGVGSAALMLVNPFRLLPALFRSAGVALRFAFVSSGVGAIVAGIAAAGTLIYQNWDGIGELFKSFGDSFMAALGPARPAIEGFAAAVSSIFDKVTGLLGPLDESGASWRAWGDTLGQVAAGGVATLVAGIQRIADAIGWVIDKARAGADAVSNFFSAGSGAPAGRPAIGAANPASGRWGPVGRDQDTATGLATGPGRASGGSVYAGGLYKINEFGQEFFKPEENGTIFPANRTPAAAPERAPRRDPAPVTRNTGPFTFNITGSAADGQRIASDIARELRGVFGDYGLDFA
ncbi:MAG TPA: phage tail tape measure protein [Xanthobacteraceae bacterium]|nr:phage tail tape measure protein [Xanthobacteraceae bacterium]